jgi:hypothetical protein
VALWSSHPAQEQMSRIRIPDRVQGFQGKHRRLLNIIYILNVQCLCVEKWIGPKNTFDIKIAFHVNTT